MGLAWAAPLHHGARNAYCSPTAQSAQPLFPTPKIPNFDVSSVSLLVLVKRSVM